MLIGKCADDFFHNFIIQELGKVWTLSKLLLHFEQLTEKEINDLPEVNNLLNIFSGVTKKSKIELINAYSGKNFSGFKESKTLKNKLQLQNKNSTKTSTKKSLLLDSRF